MHQILISYKTMSTNYNIYQKLIIKIIKPKFTKIINKLKKSKNPIFNKNYNFYIITPKITKNNNFTNQILNINIKNNKI